MKICRMIGVIALLLLAGCAAEPADEGAAPSTQAATQDPKEEASAAKLETVAGKNLVFTRRVDLEAGKQLTSLGRSQVVTADLKRMATLECSTSMYYAPGAGRSIARGATYRIRAAQVTNTIGIKIGVLLLNDVDAKGKVGRDAEFNVSCKWSESRAQGEPILASHLREVLEGTAEIR